MLTVRLLPAEEWSKLAALPPFRDERPGSPEDWQVLVVERTREDGTVEIVGTTSLFTAVHWDCWWVDPAARGRGAVFGLLLQASLAALQAAEIATVYTGVEDSAPELARLLGRFGFAPAPGRLFVLAVDQARLVLTGSLPDPTPTQLP